MKILLNPNYQSLRPFAESIAERFDREGEMVYDGRRNTIKAYEDSHMELCVKAYGRPNIFNRIVYSFLRKPKGLRAFQYPQVLRARGFESPEEIAYVEYRRFGFLTRSYFIYERCPYSRTFYEFGDATPEQYKEPITAFAHYAASLHEAGILHRDFSPGNILFDKINGIYHFSLIDINRMHFGCIDIPTGCANFARLWGQKDMFRFLAHEYAKSRQANAELCEQLVLEARRKFWKRTMKHHRIEYKLEL